MNMAKFSDFLDVYVATLIFSSESAENQQNRHLFYVIDLYYVHLGLEMCLDFMYIWMRSGLEAKNSV